MEQQAVVRRDPPHYGMDEGALGAFLMVASNKAAQTWFGVDEPSAAEGAAVPQRRARAGRLPEQPGQNR